ncbi:uncharacterized protein [Anoplolepis gracilipes]|uniref:uncharacterized protein n=1 Tax=Anoplolepis gracilipes TaxID=354296 RepID=UPI003B9ECEBD
MTSTRWKDDIVYAMTPFKLVMWPIGMWPLQVYNIYSLFRCALCICFSSLLAILPFMEIYMGCTDVEQNIHCLMMICCGILSVLKTTWFRIYPNSLINNYDSALNDYMTIDNIKERDIMRKHAFIGRFICCSMLGSTYFGCLLYGAIPFLNYNQGNRINITNKDTILEYTIPSRCALEYFNFPTSMYIIICFVEIVVIIYAATANFGNDALFINITLHVCGQVNILRIHFHNFDVTIPQIYGRFNALIQRHLHLITLARELADLISFILLIKLFIISVLLCIMGFQLILALKVHDIVMVGKSLVALSAFLFQLTLYSFVGNYLKSEMEEIGFSIYQSAWYKFPRKLTRNVLFILMQTKSPVALQAGNFIIINLSTYRADRQLLASVRLILTMTNKRWKDDVVYAMILNKLVTWPIGVWPLQVYNIYSLLRCTLCVCCASLLAILPFMEIYMGCTDVEQNIECLMLICCGILGVLKTTWFRIYAKNLINNYGSAINDYMTIDNIKERDVMRKHAFIGRIISCCILGFSFSGCLLYGTIPFLNYNQSNRINMTNEDTILKYTIPSRCAFEYFNFPTSMYKIFCLVETVVIIWGTIGNIGNDALFLNITLHVCGQVKILRIHFLTFDVTTPRIYDRFNALIQRHRYLIKLSKDLADLISFVLLIKLFIISILLCTMGFQLILALKVYDIIMVGKSLVALSAFLLQLTLYSFIGNYLKSEMEEIGLSIYQSVWYKFPRKLTRNVLFILMQTKSPVALQAGNFIIINLATYMSILKTSFSYFSVLRIMLEE